MQSIRFSKDLKNEFRNVYPDQTGYFSIKTGASVNEFIFDIIIGDDQHETETFAKKYLKQKIGNLTDEEIRRKRLDRLKKYDKKLKAGKQEVSSRSVNKSDPILKEDIKQLYRYKCQICGEQIRKFGWTAELSEQQEFEYLSADAHHIVPLQENGLDVPSNIICVCPNCHRRLHTGESIVEFGSGGVVCRNQITGVVMGMVIDVDHGLG